MRKLVYAINMTLDGCCDHTKGNPDDELMDYHIRLLGSAGLLVYGRKTWELMVPFWPDVAGNQDMGTKDNEFARLFDTIPRLVFSQTLHTVADPKTRLVRTGATDEIRRLKQEPGKDMLIGGVSLPSHLIEMGLVDEFHFVYLPVIGGAGTRLMEDIYLPGTLKMELISSKLFKSGGIALHYAKKEL